MAAVSKPTAQIDMGTITSTGTQVFSVFNKQAFSIFAYLDVTTPTDLEVKLQKSNKAEVLAAGYTYAAGDWEDVAAATAYAADDTFVVEVENPTYLAALLHVTLTGGSVAVVADYVSKYKDPT